MKRSVMLTLIFLGLLTTLLAILVARCVCVEPDVLEEDVVCTTPITTTSPLVQDVFDCTDTSEDFPTSAKDPYELSDEFLDNMIQACISGNYDLGVYYEYLRNDIILSYDLDDPIISYEDLYYMSKILHFEAGSWWMSDEHQCMVGAVLYNRSKSPEFPDTIKECVYQRDPVQYSPILNSEFESTNPSDRDIKNALLVLTEEFTVPDSIIFQANFPQGSGVYKEIYDSRLGTTTYFCYSSYPELYE